MIFQGGLGALGGLVPLLLIIGVIAYFVVRQKGSPLKSSQLDESEEPPERKRMELSQGQKVLLWVIGVLGFFGMAGGIAQLFDGRTEGVPSILFWPIVFCVAYVVIHFKNQRSAQFSASGGIDTVIVGNYLAGLPNVNQRVLAVTCDIYQDEFVFMDRQSELDRIPRNSINQITVDTKSQITQRLTATRILALGVFALAAPKKERQQEFCLLIDWDDYSGIRQNTVFDFIGPNGNALANQAANTMRRYVKVKVDPLKVNEKKCPCCAEIIKREARICKHCHLMLSDIVRPLTITSIALRVNVMKKFGLISCSFSYDPSIRSAVGVRRIRQSILHPRLTPRVLGFLPEHRRLRRLRADSFQANEALL